jgi:hypothetical protein
LQILLVDINTRSCSTGVLRFGPLNSAGLVQVAVGHSLSEDTWENHDSGDNVRPPRRRPNVKPKADPRRFDINRPYKSLLHTRLTLTNFIGGQNYAAIARRAAIPKSVNVYII